MGETSCRGKYFESLRWVLEIVHDSLLFNQLSNTSNVKQSGFPINLTFFHISLIQNEMSSIRKLKLSIFKFVGLIVLSWNQANFFKTWNSNLMIECVSVDSCWQQRNILSNEFNDLLFFWIHIDIESSYWNPIHSRTDSLYEVQKQVFSS